MSTRVIYLCDGNQCPAEKASCKRGGPCRHTSNVEHAINFKKFNETNDFYEVEAKRPRGEWITDERGYVCSECGALHADDYPFCHMCGADMRKEGA